MDSHPEVDRPPGGFDEFGVEPLGDDVGVADRRRERDDLEAGVERPQFPEGDLQSRPAFGVVDQVDLVGDDAGQVVDPARAVPNQRVDFLGGGDHNVAGGQPLAVGVVVTSRDADVEAVVLPALELGFLLGRQRAQGDDIKRLAAAGDARQHRQLGDQGLARGRRD